MTASGPPPNVTGPSSPPASRPVEQSGALPKLPPALGRASSFFLVCAARPSREGRRAGEPAGLCSPCAPVWSSGPRGTLPRDFEEEEPESRAAGGGGEAFAA
ncbi:unnamed protein product [Prorocentrum cordatum]|uniref:Uncharacterized protein n=1 Tax=Prorocentrum cordatum TaxID=2364126 RepID=A0ABN9XL73_9DINO|nr:unnamed protein product [Polarella glacialis]